MGYEYEVYVELTAAQRQELHNLLTAHPLFSGAESEGSGIRYTFAKDKSHSGMPDVLVVIDGSNLYLCSHLHTEACAYMECIQRYFLGNTIPYHINEL